MVVGALFGHLRRIFRGLLIASVTMTLLGGAMRFLAPSPEDMFGANIVTADSTQSSIERFYRLLYDLANIPRFPHYPELWIEEPEYLPPAVGMPGFSESAMGQSLSDLRSRLVGGPQNPEGELDLIDAIEHELTRPDWRGTPPMGGPTAPAEAKRLRVGE